MQGIELVSLFENLATVRQSEARICRKIAEEFKRQKNDGLNEPQIVNQVVVQEEEEWLTPKEFCKKYNVHRSTLTRHAKQGLVEVVGEARSKRYRQITKHRRSK
ncbi:hypothetical protein [Aminobacterium sp. UBA5514]|uniref:hypothetical protein n=1 Tax=Aminobacterium sp. UBA5514 TaxID=1946036 RepID=UPI00257A0812|nr:hypothetical protein [Aminobacterium sp. UBA5514]